jgi:DNA-binding NtrC family response regulator
VLQEREVERVGDSLKRKVDIRIIVATNRDLYQEVRMGRFREDLYYRLKVFPISLPPLRERREDIPLLTAHFIGLQNRKTGKQIRGITPEAMKLLMDYPWPGNVRELENAIEHGFVLASGEEIQVSDLPLELRQTAGHAPAAAGPALRNDGLSGRGHKKLTREELVTLLDSCDWNKAEAGRRIGLSRTAVWKHMKKWDIPLRRG